MIAEGTYRARAVPASVQWGVSKNDNEQVAVQFAFIDADDNDTGDALTWVGFFTEKTSQRTLESLRYAGWMGNDITDLKGLGSVPVEVVVKHEQYEGETQVRIAWINRPGGGAFKFEKPMDDTGKRKLAARLKAMAASVPTVGAAPAKKPNEKAKPPRDDAPPPHGDADGPGF